MTASLGPSLIVLAAGASTRLGQAKALVDLGGFSPLEFLSKSWPGERPATVVSGCHHKEIAAALPPGLELLYNPDWAQGRSGGIRLAAGTQPSRDLVLAPVDCPLIPREVFQAILDQWRNLGQPPRGYLAPWIHAPDGQARYGHPIVLGRELAGELQDWPPDRPLRQLRDLAAPLSSLQVSSPNILDNLDSPADLQILREQVTKRALANPGWWSN